MRQQSEYEINSTVSLFLLFGPSCVNRHASKYELALINWLHAAWAFHTDERWYAGARGTQHIIERVARVCRKWYVVVEQVRIGHRCRDRLQPLQAAFYNQKAAARDFIL